MDKKPGAMMVTYSPKKNVYAASQKDAFTDVGSAYWGPTELVANNVNIIRFSDVILWAAECAADANDLTARDFVNQVRTELPMLLVGFI